MKKLPLLISLLSFGSLLYGQEFKIRVDKDLNRRVVQYLDERIPAQLPIIVRKTTLLDDPQKSTIEIGLSIIVSSIPIDILLQRGAVVIFEDDSKLVLNEPVSTVYLYSGKHQIFVGHLLGKVELEELQKKKVKSIQISGLEQKIDKFNQDELLNVFRSIESK